jgi:hypothetical protein
MDRFNLFYRKYKSFLLPGGITIASVLIIVLGIIPLWKHAVLIYEDMQATAEQVKKLEKKISVLNGLDEAELERQFTLATSALPVEKSPPTVITTVLNLANETGVTLETLVLDAPGSLATGSAKQLSGDEQKIGAYSLPFAIGVATDITQLRSFLSKSNQIRRLVRAKSFNLIFSDEEVLKTQIYFDTFYSPLAARDSADVLPELSPIDFELLDKLEAFEDLANLPLSEDTVLIESSAPRENPFLQAIQ